MSLADQSLQCFPVSARVSVLQARGLRIKGKDGTNDTYTVLQSGRETFRTPVVEKLAEPVWGGSDAAFIFTLPAESARPEPDPLQVRVFHRVQIGADKLLGLAVIHVHELRRDGARENPQWFKLFNKAGKADKERGEVLLDIQFLKSSMSVSMIDLSDKSHSRLGKFKDKLKGKKKEGLSDSASAILPSVNQVLTDSEGEMDGEMEGEQTKKKKNKLKSLFVPKSGMKRNSLSQSMSSLRGLPDKNSSISSSTSSGLNVESSEGKKKKKFPFLTHKRNGSTDSKASNQSDFSLGSANQNPPPQVDICINGSHVYKEQTPSEGVQEMEEEEDEEEEEESWRRQEEERKLLEEERRREEERKRKEKEEQLRKEEEEKERIREREREKEEHRRRMEEEEKERRRIEREKEEQKRRMEEEEKERIRVEREREEERRRMEEEEKERRRVEREKEEQKRRMEEEEKERIRLEREREEERRRMEEEEKERKRIEREKEEQKRRVEEEEKERRRMERVKEEEMRRVEEEEKERMRMEREREEQTRKIAEEKERTRMEEKEKDRIRMEREREEQRRRVEEEERERQKIEKEEQRRKLEEEEEEERIRMKREKEEQMRKLEEERKRKEETETEELRRKLAEENARKKAEEEEKMRIAEEERKKEAEREQMMAEEKRMETERRLANEKRAREEEERRIAEEKEKQRKEEERVQEEQERKRKEEEQERRNAEMEERKKKEKQMREEQERLKKKENVLEESVSSQSTDFTRSARISNVKPSVSVSSAVSQTSMVNTNPFLDDELEASIFSSAEEKTAKKGRAPSPDFTFRGIQKQPSQVSKRPAPQPPDIMKMTREAIVTENVDQAGLDQGGRKDGHHEDTQVDTNPFTWDEPMLIKQKRPAPKPKSGISVSEDKPTSVGKILTEESVHLKEPESAFSSRDDQPNQKVLNALPDNTGEAVKNDLTDELSRREEHKEDIVQSAKPNSPSWASQDLFPEPLVCTADGLPSMERSQKKSRAPLPPNKPKRTGDSSTQHQQPSFLNKNNFEQAQENKSFYSMEKPANQIPSLLTVSSSAIAPLADNSQVVEAGSGSGSRILPLGKLVPNDAGEVRDQVDSASVFRQHAVKPLSAAEKQMETQESRLSENTQPKAKAVEAVMKGPYSQLTQSELISMALRQQEQISQRDARIQELEKYIDNLLVRVMEEKPSILMSLNMKNKSM